MCSWQTFLSANLRVCFWIQFEDTVYHDGDVMINKWGSWSPCLLQSRIREKWMLALSVAFPFCSAWKLSPWNSAIHIQSGLHTSAYSFVPPRGFQIQLSWQWRLVTTTPLSKLHGKSYVDLFINPLFHSAGPTCLSLFRMQCYWCYYTHIIWDHVSA